MPSFLKEVPIVTDFLICQIPLGFIVFFDSTGRGFVLKLQNEARVTSYWTRNITN